MSHYDVNGPASRFNALKLHDSRLISFGLIRENVKDEFIEHFVIDVELLKYLTPKEEVLKKARFIFKDCRILTINLDLLGKKWCSDSISSSLCLPQSALKNYIQREYFQKETMRIDIEHWSENSLADYLHFNLTMCPPGGHIDIFAKDFILEEDI